MSLIRYRASRNQRMPKKIVEGLGGYENWQISFFDRDCENIEDAATEQDLDELKKLEGAYRTFTENMSYGYISSGKLADVALVYKVWRYKYHVVQGEYKYFVPFFKRVRNPEFEPTLDYCLCFYLKGDKRHPKFVIPNTRKEHVILELGKKDGIDIIFEAIASGIPVDDVLA